MSAVPAALRLGEDTETGIVDGSLAAVAGAIRTACDLAAVQCTAPTDCLITGGDGHAVAAVLRDRCRYVPDLIFTGLARYADEGITQ